jgi:hypothetical protein
VYNLRGCQVLRVGEVSGDGRDVRVRDYPLSCNLISLTAKLHSVDAMEDSKDRTSTTALPLEEVAPAESPVLSRMQSFHVEEEQGRLVSDLPPVDGGRQAWSYLIAATVLETLIWGEHGDFSQLYFPGVLRYLCCLEGLATSYGGMFGHLRIASGSTAQVLPCQ